MKRWTPCLQRIWYLDYCYPNSSLKLFESRTHNLRLSEQYYSAFCVLFVGVFFQIFKNYECVRRVSSCYKVFPNSKARHLKDRHWRNLMRRRNGQHWRLIMIYDEMIGCLNKLLAICIFLLGLITVHAAIGLDLLEAWLVLTRVNL